MGPSSTDLRGDAVSTPRFEMHPGKAGVEGDIAGRTRALETIGSAP